MLSSPAPENRPSKRDRRRIRTGTVYDRMPVIPYPDSYDLWLDPGMQNIAAISELLTPYDARVMRCYPVSSRVNKVGNDDEECSQPVKIADNQSRLFAEERLIS